MKILVMTLDVINPDFLGTCWKSITNDTETILQVDTSTDEIKKLISSVKDLIAKAKAPGEVIRLEKRLARTFRQSVGCKSWSKFRD